MQDEDVSADGISGYGDSTGALTFAFVAVLRGYSFKISYAALVAKIRKFLQEKQKKGGIRQVPQLAFNTKRFDLNQPFAL